MWTHGNFLDERRSIPEWHRCHEGSKITRWSWESIYDGASYFFKSKSETCKVTWRPHLSPGCPLVVWVWRPSVGVWNAATFVPSDLIWQRKEKKHSDKTEQIYADVDNPMGVCPPPPATFFICIFFFLAHALHWFPNWATSVQPEVTPRLPLNSPLTRNGVFTVNEATKCNIKLSAHVTTRVRQPLVSAREQPSTRERTFQSQRG